METPQYPREFDAALSGAFRKALDKGIYRAIRSALTALGDPRRNVTIVECDKHLNSYGMKLNPW